MPAINGAAPTWLIVGGSRGIGLEFVSQLVTSGAYVIATARELDQSPGLQSLLEKHGGGGRLRIVRLDVTDPASAKSAAATVAESHPKGIDYLVINAGLADNHIGPTLELEVDMWKRVFDVNVFGAFVAMQAFIPLLKAKPDGRKVTAVISSSAAIVSLVAEKARAGEPLGPLDAIMPAYNASKGAVNRLTMQLANEHKKDGYTFVAIHPGMIFTDMATTVMVKIDDAVVESIKGHATPVDVSVASQIAVLKAATQKTLNGRFVDWKGEDMPW